MKNSIRTDEAIKLINYAFNLNIDPRGELNDYYYIQQILKLEDTFSKEVLIQKIMQYKEKEFKLKMERLEDKLREL